MLSGTFPLSSSFEVQCKSKIDGIVGCVFDQEENSLTKDGNLKHGFQRKKGKIKN